VEHVDGRGGDWGERETPGWGLATGREIGIGESWIVGNLPHRFDRRSLRGGENTHGGSKLPTIHQDRFHRKSEVNKRKEKEGNRPTKKGSTGCLPVTTNCSKGKKSEKETNITYLEEPIARLQRKTRTWLSLIRGKRGGNSAQIAVLTAEGFNFDICNNVDYESFNCFSIRVGCSKHHQNRFIYFLGD
jgi:hypothetical protein